MSVLKTPPNPASPGFPFETPLKLSLKNPIGGGDQNSKLDFFMHVPLCFPKHYRGLDIPQAFMIVESDPFYFYSKFSEFFILIIYIILLLMMVHNLSSFTNFP